jgi:VWFA-related protein
MSLPGCSIKLPLLLVLICGCWALTRAQDEKKSTLPNKSTERTEDDVIKISTDLIQTGVSVFDKKGQFIKDLRLEDFELSVDGKPVSVSFFERNTSGGDELKAGPNSIKPETVSNASGGLVGRGRNILFVVDDIHLSPSSYSRAKKTILELIEQTMPEDTVAIVSPSGNIGFLQQFTNDRTVLRAAVERIIYTGDKANDRGIPPMTEYEALLVSEGDLQVTDVFARLESAPSLEARRDMARRRARTALALTAIVNRGTYSTLEQVIRNSAQLPGRKVVLFMSDGFLMDLRNSDSSYLMRRITDAAARTNTVIYSIDVKGLEFSFPEGPTAKTTFAYRIQSGERLAVQDGLNLLADDTGGRFIRNTNDLEAGLTKSLEESAQYYLLAWQPVSENRGPEQLRKIEVRIKNRPDLKVRVHSGYLDKIVKANADENGKTENKTDKTSQAALSIPEQQLNAAAASLIPARTLPTSLNVNYLDMPDKGMLVAVGLQIKSYAAEFTPAEGEKATAKIDLLGQIYDSHGKREGYFRELLTVEAARSALSNAEREDIYHNYQTKLKPGLYQVRVAARDVNSGRVGSAVQWIEIPDLTTRRLALSSLILSERANNAKPGRENNVIDRRFPRTSGLQYIMFVYNAAQVGTAQPDVTVQTQIIRGNQVVVTSPPSQISTKGQDLTRLAYAAEVHLDTLPAGRYELLVLVQDRVAKANSTRSISFEVK